MPARPRSFAFAPVALVALGALVFAASGCADDGTVAPPTPDQRTDIFLYDLSVKPPDRGTAQDAAVDAAPPDSAPQPDIGGGVLVAPFSFDFEQNDGGLKGTRDWQWGTLGNFTAGSDCSSSAKAPPAAHSGSKAWGTVIGDCHNPLDNAEEACNNKNPSDDSVLSLTFVLPAPLANPRLEFWEWTDYFLSFDWAEVRVNNTVVYQDCTGSHSTPTAWRKRTIDLSAYAGATVTVSMHFMASGAVNYAGWYIDDLRVTSGP